MITFNNTKTIFELVKNTGKEYENRVFVKYERDNVIYEKGYGTFSVDALAIAAYIKSQEGKIGHAVHAAIFGKCCYEYLTVLMGVPCAGGVAIPMDIQLSEEKIIENLRKADADVFFYDAEYADIADAVMEKCDFIKRFICLQPRKNSRCVTMIHRIYRGEELNYKPKADDCAMIIFTSGTTGHGKGVMLSHRNLIDNLFCTDDDTEICLNVLPIHHVFCISGDVLLVMRYGSTLCMCDELSKMLYYIQLFQPTVIRVVPMMAKMLVNRVNIEQTKNPDKTVSEVKASVLGKRLNRLVSGGGYLSEVLSTELFKLGIVAAQGYGMSECSPKISAPDYDRPDKYDSVGRLVTGCVVRIVDGEIQVKSPSVMMGYYNDPELTKEAITEDGWLCTGDMGYIDEEDFLYLNGRKKNLIILSNGENVSPEMIENYFDEDKLIADILVYGKGEIIAAEVYPNYEYAQVNGINDIQKAVNEIVTTHNAQLPTYCQISECSVRKVPFEKTSSKKIIRKVYFDEQNEINEKRENLRKPENELQQKIYSLVAVAIGNENFGIDENFYKVGLDSMGSVMFISDIETELNEHITLAELMDNATVLELEALFEAKKNEVKLDLSPRAVYPLTGMQMYFAYVIPGNTTGNLPFSFKMSKDIDLYRLRDAIWKVLDAHPSLKAIVKPTEEKYLAIFRDDERQIDITIGQIKDAEAQQKMQELIVPFTFREDDNLVHIYLFEGEEHKYMFFDVAHLMGDGMTMNILMEDLVKAYNGEEIEKEVYTTYEYILEEQARKENGTTVKDMQYVAGLMNGIKMNRSILNRTDYTNLIQGEYNFIRKRFSSIARKEMLNYGKKYGVSENAMFIAAYNYCISLFSNEDDVFCTSIHSGRTDSRWNRLAGSLFETYFCRSQKVAHEKVDEFIKRTGNQIMETMKCVTALSRQGEMFFQYQGDILEVEQIGGAETERIHVQLDSLPFHMNVYFDDQGYYTDLRYWENRFDRESLEVFLVCLEAVLKSMLEETSVRRMKYHIPENVYPKHFYIKASELNAAAEKEIIKGLDLDDKVKIYIYDDEYKKKPYGAWGNVYIMDAQPENYTDAVSYPYGEGVLYGTGLIGRILPDGTVDFLHVTGRTVLTDGFKGRVYYDLKKAEEIINAMDEVSEVSCFMSFDPTVAEMVLCAEVKLTNAMDSEAATELIRNKAAEQDELLSPKYINFI